MKKIIEELWNKHIQIYVVDKDGKFKAHFEQAIEEAMKAQREACWIAFDDAPLFDEIGQESTVVIRDAILNAEVK